jgi:iron(III) transport system permease protein
MATTEPTDTPGPPTQAAAAPRFDGWTAGTLILAFIVAIPLMTVIVLAFTPKDNIWGHLAATVLPTYVLNTAGLAFGVGLGTLVIGVGTAWLVTMCRFPGWRLFEWALLLPVAIPAYVIAYVYTDLLEFAGPVQGLLRDLFGWSGKRDYWFPEIRSLGGAITMMTLVLYPYVYLLSRAAFIEQSITALEVSRVMGRGPWRSFFSVALPLARPAIVVGVVLVMMETLNDFGTVDFFAVETFTVGIFNVWQHMNNVAGAAQLATLLLLVVLVLIGLERAARRGQAYHHMAMDRRSRPTHRLARHWAVLAFLACFLPIVLGFILPAAILFDYAVGSFPETYNDQFPSLVANSLTIAISAAIAAVVIGLFMAYGMRLRNSRLLKAAVRG